MRLLALEFLDELGVTVTHYLRVSDISDDEISSALVHHEALSLCRLDVVRVDDVVLPRDPLRPVPQGTHSVRVFLHLKRDQEMVSTKYRRWYSIAIPAPVPWLRSWADRGGRGGAPPEMQLWLANFLPILRTPGGGGLGPSIRATCSIGIRNPGGRPFL